MLVDIAVVIDTVSTHRENISDNIRHDKITASIATIEAVARLKKFYSCMISITPLRSNCPLGLWARKWKKYVPVGRLSGSQQSVPLMFSA